MTRRDHWEQTGHQRWFTSFDLCLREGVRKGLHGWRPQETDRCALVYECTECHALLDETPEEPPPMPETPTPGAIAYAAWLTDLGAILDPTVCHEWAVLPAVTQRAWEAAAQAVLAKEEEEER